MDDDTIPPHPAHRTAQAGDMTLAALVGRQFVEALDAGLRRARATDRYRARPSALPSAVEPEAAVPAVSAVSTAERWPEAERPAVPAPERRPEPLRPADTAAALLGRHAHAILRGFETSLPLAVVPSGVPRRVSRLSLTVWAREVLRTAMDLDDPPRPRTPPPGAEQRVIAAALLLECAAVVLAGHAAGAEAIGALARAIRTPRTDAVTTRPAPAAVSRQRS
ncbi:hypothetical protein [Streptomyces scopuliridis]|uniref:Uncharacterized protein n=1 Tax=Streptomyces scopuliridis RB72 TaxID=1440053 RepID=A0A2T7SZ39_9ACTN|nr:hypothetical protein [Streptomyces scopuliridis]PVE08170.1 hypothetical protein Y717_19780 [Streptomyces scopuliridis RB72]